MNSRPLTPARARQVRLHLALIPVYGWLLLAWTTYAIDISPAGRLDRSGHIKGHDFVHFYVLGQIALDRAPDDLYSFEVQAARTDRLVPTYADRFLPIHAPQVALFFAPIARLPYEMALGVWLVLSAALYAACCGLLWKTLPNLRPYGWIVVLLSAAFPAFYALIAAGQTSAFALVWFVLGFVALRQDRPWLAGIALGSLAYKPTLGLVLPFAFLYARQIRVILGAVVAATLQLSVAWAYFGKAAIVLYVANLGKVSEFGSLLEAQPHLMHSLRSFFAMLLPSPAVAMAAYVATASVVVVIAARTWRSPAPLGLRYAVLLLATVLVDPHVYAYELVVLTPAFFLIASWAIERTGTDLRLWVLLYFCYYLSALDALTSVTRIQVSVPALAMLMALVARSAHQDRIRDRL